MIKDKWTNLLGRVDKCLRKCGLMIKNMWTNVLDVWINAGGSVD